MSTPLPRLRAAVVGLGRIGFGFHCPAIAAADGFALVAVSDPLPERLAEAGAQWRARGFAQVEEMLAAARPDLVVIASPTPFHQAQAEAALAAGAHVLCDKPVVETVAGFDRIMAAARAHGRRFVAYQPRRFAGEVRALKSLLAAGTLGHIHLIRRARCGFERRKDWQAFRVHGGGMLGNYGSHCLDELQFVLAGAAVETVYCQTRCAVTAGDAEDFVKATLTLAGGLVVDLEISQACALPGPEWEVFGSCGAARWDAVARAWRIRRFDPVRTPAGPAEQGLAAEGRRYQTETLPWEESTLPVPDESFDYYTALWSHLVRGAPPPVAMDETRRLIELIERCRRSAETGSANRADASTGSW